jgi:hypothetical protein
MEGELLTGAEVAAMRVAAAQPGEQISGTERAARDFMRRYMRYHDLAPVDDRRPLVYPRRWVEAAIEEGGRGWFERGARRSEVALRGWAARGRPSE